MKGTKLELQQTINRLAADNQFLREKNFELQAKLEQADVRCKKLIASRNHGNPERRALMEQARALAMSTGKNVSTRDLARASNEGGGSAPSTQS